MEDDRIGILPVYADCQEIAKLDPARLPLGRPILYDPDRAIIQ
jgi:hypothetical protein